MPYPFDSPFSSGDGVYAPQAVLGSEAQPSGSEAAHSNEQAEPAAPPPAWPGLAATHISMSDNHYG